MKTKKARKRPITLPVIRKGNKHWSTNTFASWEWARESAHGRKYEAVFDTVPNANSIVSIIWWIISSENSWGAPEEWLYPLMPYLASLIISKANKKTGCLPQVVNNDQCGQ